MYYAIVCICDKFRPKTSKFNKYDKQINQNWNLIFIILVFNKWSYLYIFRSIKKLRKSIPVQKFKYKNVFKTSHKHDTKFFLFSSCLFNLFFVVWVISLQIFCLKKVEKQHNNRRDLHLACVLF